jgi:ribosomal protein S18 acetylase RimI-like enzyme
MEVAELRSISTNDYHLEYYLEKINALLEALSRDKPLPYQITYADLFTALASNDFELVILEVNNEVAGMGSIHFHRTLTKWAAYIEDVVVFPEFQGKRYGKKIVQHLIDYAKSRDVKFVELTSNPKRIAANALYKSLGFVVPGTNLYRLFTK